MMSKLMAIAETVVLEKVLAHTFPVAKKSRAGLALLALSGLLVVVATGFLITAFYAWVLMQFTPDIAALITACAIFALALVFALASHTITHQRQLRVASVKNEMKANLASVLATFDDELGDHVRENPATAVALAGLAGFILADRVL